MEALNVPEDKKGKKTVNIEKHYPTSYGAILIDCPTNSVDRKSFYRGKDCISKLMNRLRKWLAWSDSEAQKNRKLSDVLSSQQHKQMTDTANGAECCICGEVVQAWPVVHHRHSSGKIIGVAHSKCNFQARTKRFLPVFFHNLSRYDAHHIVKQLISLPNGKLSVIGRVDEVYISFSLRMKISQYTCKDGRVVPLNSEITFLDSFQIMSQSLEGLGKKMVTSKLLYLRQKFSSLSDDNYVKFRGKGYFPYFLDSFGKFDKLFPEYGTSWTNNLPGTVDITEKQYEKT